MSENFGFFFCGFVRKFESFCLFVDGGWLQAKDKLEKSMVADNDSGKSVESEVRTSSGMFLEKNQVIFLQLNTFFVFWDFVVLDQIQFAKFMSLSVENLG